MGSDRLRELLWPIPLYESLVLVLALCDSARVPVSYRKPEPVLIGSLGSLPALAQLDHEPVVDRDGL
jgi:hypothetical protein